MAEAIPVLGITGASGSGKTTVLEALIAVLRQRGWRVAVLKHAPGGFTLDRPGKDSWRLTEAGAGLVMLHSDRALAVLAQTPGRLDPARTASGLAVFCHHLGLPRPDLLLIEGHHGLEVPSVHVEGPGRHRAPGPRCLGVVSGPDEAPRLADLVEQALGLVRPEGEPER